MKKAKVLLTAITVLAVVGGALAFKANSFQRNFLYTCPSDVCVSTTIVDENDLFKTTTQNGVIFNDATITDAAIAPNTPCEAKCDTDLQVTVE